ncbi:hypothetical protein ACVI8K_000502 [Bradyrhizobium barranii subsp. barranii]
MDHPDMALPVDGDAADLAEDPVVRQRCFGQEASTAKVGTSPAVAVPGSTNAMAAIRMEKA